MAERLAGPDRRDGADRRDGKSADGADSAPVTAVPSPTGVTGSMPVWSEPVSAASLLGGATTSADLRYELGAELARGGTGRVRRARDRRLSRLVAVKELIPSSPAMLIRFEREIRITARLQHPAIVPIYDAGHLVDGEPYYVMRLVAGRSLHDAIAAAASPAERLALLPSVLTAVEAVAYAHSQRIIHRDLKPLNILVGDFGETVVIDWGLARDLGPDGDSDDRQVRHGADRDWADGSGDRDLGRVGVGTGSRPGLAGVAPLLTTAGDVLGTPAYMAPEQASGKPVDERADVYALGAILYHVLSGAAPFRGGSAQEVVEQVVTGPPPSLRVRQPGLPDDLLAIVDKAMARQPSGRYPTAGELAADLRRLQTGQLVGAHRYTLREHLRRWLRRYRATVAVAAVLLVALVAVAGVSIGRVVVARNLAEQHRAAAETARSREREQRAAAEELVDFMLSDLRGRLAPLRKLALLEGVGDRVRRYYGLLLASAEEDGAAAGGVSSAESDTILRRRYQAERLLADARRAKADHDGALRSYQEGLALATRLGDKGLIARSQLGVADMMIERGDQPGATAAFAAALSEAERAGDDELLWSVLTHQGELHPDARHGLDLLRRAAAIAERLSGEPGTPRLWSARLAETHDYIGRILAAHGNLAGARDSFTRALELLEAIPDPDPPDLEILRGRASALEGLGTIEWYSQDFAGCLATARRSLVLREQIAAHDRDNLEWLAELAKVHGDIGNALVVTGKHAEALVEYQAEMEGYRRLAVQDPDNLEYGFVYAMSHDRVGGERYATGDRAAGLADYRVAVSRLEALLARDPTRTKFLGALAAVQRNLGETLASSGDEPAAIAAFRAAIAAGERNLALDPNGPAARFELADPQSWAARLLRRHPASAAEARQLATACIETLTPLETSKAIRPNEASTLATCRQLAR